MMRRRFIFEADDEDEAFAKAAGTSTASDSGDDSADDTADDNAADEGNDDTAEETSDEGNEDSGEDDNSPEESNEEESEEEEEPSDDDFTIKDPEEEPEEETKEDDKDSDDKEESSDDSGEEGSEDDTVDSPLKAAERDLFDSLSAEEKEIKNTMLKKLFIELYSNCDAIINKFNDIGTELEEVSLQIKRVLAILFNLKQMIDDYLMHTYKTKTYIENDIMFNRYLSILNSVKNIVKDIDKYYEDAKSDKK